MEDYPLPNSDLHFAAVCCELAEFIFSCQMAVTGQTGTQAGTWLYLPLAERAHRVEQASRLLRIKAVPKEAKQ